MGFAGAIPLAAGLGGAALGSSGGKKGGGGGVPGEFDFLPNIIETLARRSTDRAILAPELVAQGRGGISDVLGQLGGQTSALGPAFGKGLQGLGNIAGGQFLGEGAAQLGTQLNELLTPLTQSTFENLVAPNIREQAALSGNQRGTNIVDESARSLTQLGAAQGGQVAGLLGQILPGAIGAGLAGSQALTQLPGQVANVFSGPTQFEAGLPLSTIAAAGSLLGGTPFVAPQQNTKGQDLTGLAGTLGSAYLLSQGK